MSYLVRKIARTKWLLEIKDNPFDIPADTITSDLKSTSNTLSVWEVEQETDLTQAVIALVAAGDRLDTIDIVWMPKDEIDTKKINCDYTLGLTRIESLRKTHIDLSGMNYFKIGLFAESIISNIAAQRIKRYTKGELKKLLNKAIQDGIFLKTDLHEKIQEKL